MGETNALDLPVYLIFFGILGMLLLAIAVIVFFLVYQKRLFAQRESMRLMEAAHQKNLLQYSFEAQEAERKRIASDLHDDMGSILSAARIYLRQLNPDKEASEYQEIKEETTELLDSAITRLRVISHNLFPPNLDRFGLKEACEDFCGRIEKVNNIKFSLYFDDALHFDKKEELALYRILQELTNNTLKHAQASTIDLAFHKLGGNFKMLYRDDGVGFSYDVQKTEEKGLGLKTIESRANAIGAQLLIESEPDEGIAIELIKPLPNYSTISTS